MELVAFLIDFILHVDVHLANFVQNYGTWVYALLFVIIFVETGVVVMPFLPGDSLLFVVGALCGLGLMNLPLTLALLAAAAILGDQCNYTIGRWVGPKVFRWEQSRWFNRRAFDQAHAFYEKYGGVTIVVARFLPFWNGEIAPAIKSGKNVIIAAHGNSLRALVKHLDNVGTDDIVELNIPTGIPLVYELDKDLKPLKPRYYLGDAAAAEAAAEADGAHPDDADATTTE